MWYAITVLSGLISLVCYILVLVKLFRDKGVLHGLLGLFCGIYAFIWGLMEIKRQQLKWVMIVWIVCVVLAAVGRTIVESGATPG